MAALLPAIILCVYIYKKDRSEKEPIRLLVCLAFAGVLCCFPASLIESNLIDFIESFFVIRKADDGTIYMAKNSYYIYSFIKNFICVALVEEGLKWIALIYISKKNKNFNCLFDGMIYAIFVSLGFAALENIMYVVDNGWYVAFLRAFLSVPGHMFFAVMMGYHYSLWNIYDKAVELENQFIESGKISRVYIPFSSRSSKVNSLLIPVLAHGFYDFCCTTGNTVINTIFYVFIIFLYVHCFKKIRMMSSADVKDTTYAMRLVIKKYPKSFPEWHSMIHAESEEVSV